MARPWRGTGVLGVLFAVGVLAGFVVAEAAEPVTDAGTGTPVKPVLAPAEACANGPTPECYQRFSAELTCPATRAEVPVGALCGIRGQTEKTRCLYPEGQCRCVHHLYCGGPTPSFLQMNGSHWECGPLPQATDCPEAAPGQGSTCAVKGKVCDYGGCGSSTQCTCAKGKWSCGTRYWAPPP